MSNVQLGKPLTSLERLPVSGTCSFPDCTNDNKTNLGFCNGHYEQKRSGKSLTPLGKYVKKQKRGTGSYIDAKGYRWVTGQSTNPLAEASSVLEHRLIMAEHLGRPLSPHENVHHKNGDRLSNLELWSTSQPSGQRVEDKIEWAKELLLTYEPEALSDQIPNSQRKDR